MPTTQVEKKSQLIDKITRTVKERLPEPTGAMAALFTHQYYRDVAPEDLLETDWEDLYGAVLAHWNFMRQRSPGKPTIRVYNPTYDEHGWQSTHTVVEIVTDDMPFLVDSMSMELNRHSLTLHRIIHPVLKVARDDKGRLLELVSEDADSETAIAEAVMHFEVDNQTDPKVLDGLKSDLLRVLGDVRAAVEDWQPMRQRLLEIIQGLDPAKLPADEEEIKEAQDYLNWVLDNHFTLLGSRRYDLIVEDEQLTLQADKASGLGILRDENIHHAAQHTTIISERQRELAVSPQIMILTKANTRSTVHRPAHLDYIGIKRFDDQGKVIGEWRLLGLYTSLAYSLNPRHIPLLRSKIKNVLKRANLAPVSHTGKALQHILDTFPRDELFQATVAELHDIALGILHLEERQRLRLLVRQDAFERFFSCLVYVPRERYNTELRIRMQSILMEAFNGTGSEFAVHFSETVLARVLITVYTQPGQIPDYSVPEIETKLREAMLSWADRLEHELLEQVGEESSNALFNLYGQAFPAGYREDFSARTAVRDILRLEKLGPDNPLEMHLYRPLEDPEERLSFKVFGREQAMPLSDALPMLEKLGLRVLTARPYELELSDGRWLWILDFDLKEDHGIRVEVAQVREIFQEAFARIRGGDMENDGFSRLVLAASLDWRDVVMLRAYCKYLLQTRAPFSQAYMEQALNNHPHITRMLAELFHARFDPDLAQGDSGRRTTALGVNIEEALDQVSNLDEDRIIRRFFAVLQATLRTNFFQVTEDGRAKEYLSFKFDPARIPEMPLPLPMFEIFVYSPRTEGIHLRGGPVARGGLRWSDRREDFRTEVLGLMKAQMVKNAVIVPVGSKGGFVLKRPPQTGGREALQQEVVHCYTSFISGMLDITDNLVGGQVVPPPRVVRYDDDDPYLVVAADKGTATFSDLANSIAINYGFWLGDAFASGGSAGYDHKKMGITARGAWESVKRHFRELGKNIQAEDFTVVGIGDMGGDVFGNGMLLSRHIKLLAAFNHLHIFIDPNPDPETTYVERERMFKLSRSTWEDYNKDLISKGGGIYARSLKSITLSAEAREALGIQAEKLTPNELIHQILKAPVELLWNGGIGTYVKAAHETHGDAGDRANDAVRVNGRDLRCKVMGEGGNLGFTQLGRIEFARRGGHIYTDAIDNSGGVDSSDHEVNIKILLNQAVDAGDMTLKQRNQLLADMTDEVADLVLRHNYLQTQAISATASRAGQMLGEHARVIRRLEKAGKLNREIEYLPSDEELSEREAAKEGLCRPELAVLLAYSKITLFEELVNSDIPNDPYLQKELAQYFPPRLSPRFAPAMESHRLRKEIITTYITNSMLNRMGSVFVFKLKDTGESAPDIARAYAAAREMYRARELWANIEALDNQVPAKVQIDMNFASRHLIERASLWLLRNRRPPLDIQATVDQFGGGITRLADELPGLLPPQEAEAMGREISTLTETGVPEELAQWVASLNKLYSALDIIEVANQAELSVEAVTQVYFGAVSRLRLNWLHRAIIDLPAANHWQDQAKAALLNNLYEQQRGLAATVLRQTDTDQEPKARLDAWLERNRVGLERVQSLFADLGSAGQPDLAMLSVALRETGGLLQGD